MNENGEWRHPDNMYKLNAIARLSSGDNGHGWSIDGLAYDACWNSTDQVPLALIQSDQLCRYCALDPSDDGRTARQILSGRWYDHSANGYLKRSGYAEHYRLRLWSNFTYFENDPLRGDPFNQRDSRHIFGGKVAKGCRTSCSAMNRSHNRQPLAIAGRRPGLDPRALCRRQRQRRHRQPHSQRGRQRQLVQDRGA